MMAVRGAREKYSYISNLNPKMSFMVPNSPVVSIVIPAYNIEAYLARTLDSLLAQTYGDFEIIVVNDCSPDGLSAIAHRYAERDARIRVIDKPVNQGTMEARRTGCEAARGEYIVFCDGDDLMPADALERMLAQMDADTDMLLCGVRMLWPNGHVSYRPRVKRGRVPESRDELYEAFIRKRITWYLCAGMFRRSLFGLELVTFVGQSLNEDYMLLLQLLQFARGVRFYDAYVYDYIRTAESMTYGRPAMRKLRMELKANQWCCDFLCSRSIRVEDARWQYVQRVYHCIKDGFTRRRVLETGPVDRSLFNLRNIYRYLGFSGVMKYFFWCMVSALRFPSCRPV